MLDTGVSTQKILARNVVTSDHPHPAQLMLLGYLLLLLLSRFKGKCLFRSSGLFFIGLLIFFFLVGFVNDELVVIL